MSARPGCGFAPALKGPSSGSLSARLPPSPALYRRASQALPSHRFARTLIHTPQSVKLQQASGGARGGGGRRVGVHAEVATLALGECVRMGVDAKSVGARQLHYRVPVGGRDPFNCLGRGGWPSQVAGYSLQVRRLSGQPDPDCWCASIPLPIAHYQQGHIQLLRSGRRNHCGQQGSTLKVR